LPVTVSIGVAVFEDQLETPQQLFARADRALYRAKAAGRNRCRMAPPQRMDTSGDGGDSRFAGVA
jgi:diguanylate cyclase (GGDEF)-like protein